MGGHGGHQTHRLHDTDRVTLWRLYRADEPPRRPVELARSQELARLLYGCLDTADMRESSVIRQAVQNLRDTRLGGVGERC